MGSCATRVREADARFAGGLGYARSRRKVRVHNDLVHHHRHDVRLILPLRYRAMELTKERSVFDFVMGIGVGIILACVSFVVSSSQRRAVRSILNGAVARSTVRRHPKQSAFLKEVGRQTRVIKLQGFLFFGSEFLGTKSRVEAVLMGLRG